LHTDETLEIFEKVTKDLGNCIHMFAADTCLSFTTKELSHEVEARQQCQGQKDLGRSSRSQGATSDVAQGRQLKGLNIQTYKLHALTDYPAQIRMYGTTDSYSTQSHHTSKVQFARTSRKAYVLQLASIERWQAHICCICLKRDALNVADPVPNKAEQHHIIGESQNFLEDLTSFMQTNMGDPAIQHFILKLKAHILPRIAAIHQDANSQAMLKPTADNHLDDPNDSILESHPLQLNHVLFKGNKIYCHCLLPINYMTYDLQCGFNSINPHTDHRDVMLLSNLDNNSHPFSYAQCVSK
ncbi:hypothetical protein SCLCIDRAFT_125548, partial [Scleroderma citrinum Foug A]